MSIASEITRLQGVKSDILQAISDKGVVVPAGSALDDCPELIASISGGGGGFSFDDFMYLSYFNKVIDISDDTNGCVDYPLKGGETQFNKYAYTDANTIGQILVDDSHVSAANINRSTGWNSTLSTSNYIDTSSLLEFTSEIIAKFSCQNGERVHISLAGSFAEGGIQICAGKFWGKEIYLFVPSECQSSINVYNGASGSEPDRIKIPVDNPTEPHKHQLHYDNNGWSYYCDGIKYVSCVVIPNEGKNFKLRVVPVQLSAPIQITQLALVPGPIKNGMIYLPFGQSN